MTQAEKAAAIGGGARPVVDDDSSRIWACGCYEDQGGYHLCLKHPDTGARPPQQEYRCPNCGKTLKFNEWNGSVCPYCNYILAERRAESAESRLTQLRALIQEWRDRAAAFAQDAKAFASLTADGQSKTLAVCADELDALLTAKTDEVKLNNGG
jgi:DNA-directed RNA polymerase subunit RPC12/RpoP